MKRVIVSLIIAVPLFSMAQNISTVISYDPMPGQFINLLPVGNQTDNAQTMAAAAQQAIEKGSGMISLGAFGGSVTLKLNEPLFNSHAYDFAIFGNAYKGASEPGVVLVSEDVNGNGVADDQWYELAGSEYEKSTHDYTITYYRPSAQDDESEEFIENYIRWEDNLGGSGYLAKNTYHQQPYFPSWKDEQTLSFTGTLLPCNMADTLYNNKPGFTFRTYSWGYADNYSNKEVDGCSFKIDWAVDDEGNAVELNKIDFVKIYTGVIGGNPVTGEISTEFAGIFKYEEVAAVDETQIVRYYVRDNVVYFAEPLDCQPVVYSILGQRLMTIPKGIAQANLSSLKHGIYILQIGNQSIKVVVK